ncbi:MAG: DUF3108 domain-containing protein [Chthoniobacterales bacterium]
MSLRLLLLSLVTVSGVIASPRARAAGWEATVAPFAPGNFPEPRSVRAQYVFGWSGLTAAKAELHFYRADDRFVLDGSAETIGAGRGLWPFEVQHNSTTDARTLRPIHVKEVETRRSKKFDSELNFTAERVTSHRIETRDAKTKASDRTFEFPNAMSLNSALLYLRSKALADGSVERIVVYPGRTPYLCTVSILGREPFSGPTGTHDAIKLDVRLSKIENNHELKPHKKFKRATVWISNDQDRLILRIEAQIFLGTVFAELQSVQFENAKQ